VCTSVKNYLFSFVVSGVGFLLYERGDKTCMTHYRPVSLTVYFKVLEKAVHSRSRQQHTERDIY
jgi:hypothetical protein